jgi:chromosome segregation ATPase
MVDAEFPKNNGVVCQSNGNGGAAEAIGDGQSIGIDVAEGSLPDIENHANRLLNLLNELRSFADDACDAVLREAECADRVEETMEAEINGLREQIREKEESLQARETALAQFEETAKAKYAELEGRIQDQEVQLNNRDIQSQHLASERDFLVDRLKEAELAAEQAEAREHQFTERLEAEFTDLKLQLAKREESLGARELALTRHEGELRTSIQTLQLRLQETEAKLASRDRELKQKEGIIDAAAARETEIGKLIERLSAECEKLSEELCEKRIRIARLQDKTRHSTNGGKVWKKVFNLEQEEAF